MEIYTSIDSVIDYRSPFFRYNIYHNCYCRDGYKEGKKYYGLQEDRDKLYSIKDIAQIDSGYVKDVFLQWETVVFSESDFQTLKKITKGHGGNVVIKEIASIYEGVYFEPYLYDFNDGILEFINKKRMIYHEFYERCTSYKIDDNLYMGFYSPASDGEYYVDIMFGDKKVPDKSSVAIGAIRIVSAYCKIKKKYDNYGHSHLGWGSHKWDYTVLESCAIIALENKYSFFSTIESQKISFYSLENFTAKIELLNLYIDKGYPIEMIDFDFRVPSFYQSKLNTTFIRDNNLKCRAENNNIWDAARAIKYSVHEHVKPGNGRTNDYAWDEEMITIEEVDLYMFCLIYVYFNKRLRNNNKEYFEHHANCASHYPGIEMNYKSDMRQGELVITNYGAFGHGLTCGTYKGEKPLETDEYRRLIRFLIQNFDGDLRIFINMMLSNDIKKVSSIIEKQVPIIY